MPTDSWTCRVLPAHPPFLPHLPPPYLPHPAVSPYILLAAWPPCLPHYHPVLPVVPLFISVRVTVLGPVLGYWNTRTWTADYIGSAVTNPRSFMC